MRTRIFVAIFLASVLAFGLFTALTGHATSFSSDYTLATADGLALTLSADGQIAG